MEQNPEISTSVAPEETQPLRRELRSWGRDVVIALSLAIVIIIFFYQPVKVEGTSMTPLISDQERIFINKFVYRFEPIGRGDVVMGDHRTSSNDSRIFGPVPRQFIYGKAVFAYWPVEHFGSIPVIAESEK